MDQENAWNFGPGDDYAVAPTAQPGTAFPTSATDSAVAGAWEWAQVGIGKMLDVWVAKEKASIVQMPRGVPMLYSRGADGSLIPAGAMPIAGGLSANTLLLIGAVVVGVMLLKD